jgi:hypothetical protein
MNRFNYQQMMEYTVKHVYDPQPGDHFTEMCGSVAYIESRDGALVTFRRTGIINGSKNWKDPETIPVSEFVRWAGGDKPWLELYPSVFPKELLEGG